MICRQTWLLAAALAMISFASTFAGGIEIDTTIESCAEASAVFGRGSVCYVRKISEMESVTEVQLCAGISAAAGAGGHAEVSHLLCVKLRIPGRIDRATAIRVAEQSIEKGAFVNSSTANKQRWQLFEKSLQDLRVVTPDEEKARELQKLLDELPVRK